MVHHSRLEVYFDLLQAVEKGIDKPTNIMCKAHLSWKNVKEILSLLASNGFIREEQVENSKNYHITEKGHKALTYHRTSLQGLE
jgi:predicted transcriptional regulator